MLRGTELKTLCFPIRLEIKSCRDQREETRPLTPTNGGRPRSELSPSQTHTKKRHELVDSDLQLLKKTKYKLDYIRSVLLPSKLKPQEGAGKHL